MHSGATALLTIFFAASSATSVASEIPDSHSPGNATQVSTAPPAPHIQPAGGVVLERNIAIFAGNAQLGDARITTTYQCLICAVTSGSQDFQFGQGSISGIRAELWGRHFGAAFEFSSTSNIPSVAYANGASATIGLNSVSIIPMLRMPFFPTDSMPDGRLHLYGGLGLDFISWMSLEVSMPGQPLLSAHLSGRYNNASPGTLMLAGASWSYAHWIIFAEYRSLETRIAYDGAIDNFGLAPVRTADIPIHMTQTIAGIKYRF
ncbi:MAG: hypothetical protein PHY50_06700 [Sideroxydans sp.]|nr:hypothetical protein [Sideroxydans sp.]